MAVLCAKSTRVGAAQLGKNPKYISQVLNGHYEPKKAEREFNAALSAIIEGRQEKED